ncbi:hypothetical protein E0F15_08840 [Frankia sp. B2]|uniref:hypothetical protein n=2 Tax=unclassified Frankia TaxID=2632575 RepID=UPI0004611EF6|nr:hypothetical protein [Frankia sp. BMG5.23]KDA41211.1 hypothetical protein BMG523Draft_03992 [Frankia sp. BMG5.23]TFE32143.1 hypothetical protein E0F15_08840 [Frankia sp. B2]
MGEQACVGDGTGSGWSEAWSRILAGTGGREAATVWVVAVVDGPDRDVDGVVGYFATPRDADRHACAHGYGEWLVVPALVLHRPDDPVVVL